MDASVFFLGGSDESGLPSLLEGKKRCDILHRPVTLCDPVASVLIRELPLEHVAEPASWPEAHPGPSPAVPQRRTDNPFVQVETEKITLGKPKDFPRCVLVQYATLVLQNLLFWARLELLCKAG